MNEEWRPVCRYEGYYSVSNLGRVWSHHKNRLLKPISTSVGYQVVHLSVMGKAVRIPIHRIVAKAFIPNPLDKPTVNHINEIKSDNRVENLEWATVLEQNIHGTRIARAVAHTDWTARNAKTDYAVVASKHNYHEMNRSQMRPVLQLDKQGSVIARHDSISQAARSLGIQASHICCCLKGRRKTCGGYKWEYA